MLYQTQARIHLGSIGANLAAIRGTIGSRKLLVSVKANGYGHGAIPMGRLEESCGVDWLGVATVPEGQALRAAGIKVPILKLSGTFPEEMEAAIAASLTLNIGDLDSARALEAVCAALRVQGRVHLEIETGMGRSGATIQDAPALAGFLEHQCPHLHLEGVFTHLPMSDQADVTCTRAQIARFEAVLAQVEAAMGRRPELVHCANSGGVLGHPCSWMDMVRVGIMAYGYYPDAQTPRTVALRPGLSFVTRVTFLKKVEAGTTIGYGRSWEAKAPTWIATLCAGYADGFDRRFSNKGRVLIGGRSYPVVGRVCMDQTMVDLGPETDIRVGDEAVLIGRSGALEITVEEWAAVLGTISYEVTCNIADRVERVLDLS